MLATSLMMLSVHKVTKEMKLADMLLKLLTWFSQTYWQLFINYTINTCGASCSVLMRWPYGDHLKFWGGTLKPKPWTEFLKMCFLVVKYNLFDKYCAAIQELGNHLLIYRGLLYLFIINKVNNKKIKCYF